MNATYIPLQQPFTRELPSRGRVGMFVLIAAEAAIFTIFVVAYIFYTGKSLTGPTPQDVLAAPIFFSICLLSSSDDPFGSQSASSGKRQRFLTLVARHHHAG